MICHFLLQLILQVRILLGNAIWCCFGASVFAQLSWVVHSSPCATPEPRHGVYLREDLTENNVLCEIALSVMYLIFHYGIQFLVTQKDRLLIGIFVTST